MKAPQKLSVQSLILKQNIDGDTGTITTYNGRLISDYALLIFLLRYDLNDTLVRASFVTYPNIFGSVNLGAHHGVSNASYSAMTITKINDTSCSVEKNGSKGLHSIEVVGVKLS